MAQRRRLEIRHRTRFRRMGDLQHALAKALSLDAEIMIALADKRFDMR
jgi:hypothetical protein